MNRSESIVTCTSKNKTLEGAPVQGIGLSLDQAVDVERSMYNYNYYHYVQLVFIITTDNTNL